MMYWAELPAAEKRRWVEWVVGTCELFGAGPGTSHGVASLFYNGLESLPPDDGSAT